MANTRRTVSGRTRDTNVAVSVSPSANGIGQVRRTTLVLPESLDENLEAYALRSGITKSQVIKRLLREFLIENGLQPDKKPRVQISY